MKYSKFIILYGLALAFFSCSILKKRQEKTVATANAMAKNVADTAKKAPPAKLKPYDQVITKKAVTGTGLFKVHQVEGKCFFEIPDSLMETDLLIVNRISKGATGASQGISGYSGDQINENVLRFTKGPKDKLFIKSMSYTERSTDSTDNGMYRSVRNSSLQPIVAAFDVKALSKDSSAVVIDVTDYLNADNEVLFFNTSAKGNLKLGGLQADKSYISSVKTFSKSLEIKTVKTYGKTPSGTATYELNSSIIRLPEKPMSSRAYDDRVGYFATGYVDFDRNPQGVAFTGMITRWRLEPKKEEEAKYLRGELVEPKQPIVFYIDPATPKKWVPYLIQGVNDWNVAFEAAGFKNAIIAREAPTNTQDSTWSMESARHNVIVYKPSAVPNASGPHVHDPRTGEILETHINWYHNVMQLLRNWYFIQASAVDPKARKMKFDDDLMGQLIRFVSSHEVGHTLGLLHNFGSSSTVPVEKLRDKAWVEANGHTPSIMDYARFNYVAQPEDRISEKGIFPRIGEYDKWAIEWGYRWWPQMPREEEETKLNQWIIARTSDNKSLWFGQEQDPFEPRSQSEDLGDDAMKASAYGVKNLQRIVPRLMEWTKEKNEGYGNLRDMYNETLNQFYRYTGHVLKNIGGIMTTKKAVEEKGAVIAYVPKATQKRAMAYLDQYLFTTPTWLFNWEILNRTEIDPVKYVSAMQGGVLNRLLSPVTLGNLTKAQEKDGLKAYTAVELLADVKQIVWTELKSGKSVDVYRRNLQKNYVNSLVKLAGLDKSPAAAAAIDPVMGALAKMMGLNFSDATSLAKMQVKELQREIKTAIPKMKDKMSRYHLLDCLDQINRALVIK
ncbi:zinc-dependent metalloprotease [Pedobacter heparinus]|uniref:zinc-dependent metalloprotease n=1 Tax=Pedobacter heparinus TaxID=984 RepID=UPI0029316B64|nr:zinc-dependent metalloprotease [Pedobacter heparinus]